MSTSFFNQDLLISPASDKQVATSAVAKSHASRLLPPVVFFAVIPFLVFVVLYSSNINGAIDLFHEGESLSPAFEVSHGKLPFRDVYLQHGWGVNVLRTKLAFFLFGQDSVAANRTFHFGRHGVLTPIIWIGVYLLLYTLFRRKIWILPAFLLLGLADIRFQDRHLLPILSIALLAWGTQGRRNAFLFSGALAGAAIFYSLDMGIYAVLIGFAFIASYSIGDRSSSFSDFGKSARHFAIGAAIGAFPFILYLLWHGIFDDFVRNSYLQLRYQQEVWGIPPPSPASLLGPFKTVTARNRALYAFIKWYFPALVYVLTALSLAPAIVAGSFDKRDAPLLLMLIMGIFFFPSALGRADEGHLMYAIAPFWILGMVLLELSSSLVFSRRKSADDVSLPPLHYRRLYRGALVTFLIILAFGLYFWATCRNGGILQQRFEMLKAKPAEAQGNVNLQGERSGNVRVPEWQEEEIEKTVAFIDSHAGPDEPIFDFSNQGAYYFLAGRRNSTMFCQAAYAIPEPLQQKAVAQLEQAPPAAVILREDAKYAPHKREPLIDEWIRQRYAEAAHIGRNIILLPKPH
jgi:hypothetical protein